MGDTPILIQILTEVMVTNHNFIEPDFKRKIDFPYQVPSKGLSKRLTRDMKRKFAVQVLTELQEQSSANPDPTSDALVATVCGFEFYKVRDNPQRDAPRH